MRRAAFAFAFAFVFAVGAAVGAYAAKKLAIVPGQFQGKPPAEAAASLLVSAQSLAENGTFENIAVGRVLYLSGKKNEAKAIFDRVLGGKHDAGVLIRVARVHREAGEWEAAAPLFEQVLALEPKDEDWLAEIGAYYLLAGDRAKGEALLARSFVEDPSNLYNALRGASGYLGIDKLP
jgi:tetratricopeptide (TPR) repeat protein